MKDVMFKFQAFGPKWSKIYVFVFKFYDFWPQFTKFDDFMYRLGSFVPRTGKIKHSGFYLNIPRPQNERK